MEMPKNEIGAKEALSPKEIESILSEKTGIDVGYLEDLAQAINNVDMNGKPEKINVRFGLEQDAIKMKNFLQSNNVWTKESFRVEVVSVDRMKEIITIKLEKVI